MKSKINFFVIILILILIGSLITAYGIFLGTKGFIVKEYRIKNTKITENYHGFKIAHISDIHYTEKSSKSELKKIVADINKLKPDIVVLTGDLVDAHISDKESKELAKIFKSINAKINKYAIDGNHDYEYKKWSSLIEDMGFVNLNDSYDLIYNDSFEPIFIAGISNNTHTIKNIKDKSEGIFNYLNSEENNSVYSILLIHEPDYIDEIDYKKFDLIFSGHSHNGQVRIPYFGAIVKVPGAKKYYDEYYKLKKTDLYISSGIGTTTIPIRLFNKPSYNFYRITKETE